MKETTFIEQNKKKWAEFEQLLEEKKRDPEKLNELFIQVTDDLSYARTFYPNRSVRVFLNALAQRVFHDIYRGRRFPLKRLRLFWTDELPRIMWDTRLALLLSFCIFVFAFIVGVVSSRINPDFARVILGDSYVEMTLTNIENGDPMAVYKDAGPLGSSVGIAANNLFVALRTAIFGVLASIGTVFIMLYNGVMVGAFQYFFIEKGVFWESFLTIWIHGTLEISAIIIAGAAGLVAGSGLLFPGTYRRVQAFQISMRRSLKIFIGIVPIIIIAGFIEGFLTRFTETPDVIRALFILSSLLFVLWYFVWLPRHLAKTKGFRSTSLDYELPPNRTEVIDFERIKTVGEILSDGLSIWARHARTLFFSLLAAAGAFVVGTFSWSPIPIAETFPFRDLPLWPLDILAGTVSFFWNQNLPGLFFFQVLLLTGLALAAFRAIEKEMNPSVHVPLTGIKWVIKGLPLLLVMALFAIILSSFTDFWAVMLSWIALPFLALWASVLYFEISNPFKAVSRSLELVKFGPLLGIGLLLGLLNLLFFMFLESPIWDMTLQLFSWLVPPVEGAMQTFLGTATTCFASLMLYVFTLLTLLCGGTQYFSFREIKDARSLQKNLEDLGKTRKIRGLARE